jgi:hypothetical protein
MAFDGLDLFCTGRVLLRRQFDMTDTRDTKRGTTLVLSIALGAGLALYLPGVKWPRIRFKHTALLCAS